MAKLFNTNSTFIFKNCAGIKTYYGFFRIQFTNRNQKPSIKEPVWTKTMRMRYFKWQYGNFRMQSKGLNYYPHSN